MSNARHGHGHGHNHFQQQYSQPLMANHHHHHHQQPQTTYVVTNPSSSSSIFGMLGVNVAEVVAANEEARAAQAHMFNNPQAEAYHLQQAAQLHHAGGNHYAEMRDQQEAQVVRYGNGCSIM